MKIIVENPKQFLNVLYQEMVMYFKKELEYRWQVFVWVISDLLQPLLLGMVWISVARQGSILSVNQIVTYFFLVAIVSKLTKDWSVVYISNSVISGEFSKYLVKPFNYLAETLGISLGVRVLRLLLLVPILTLVGVFFSKYLYIDFTFERVMLSLLALIFAFSINFLLGNTFALISFYINQILGLRAFYEHVALFLSGEAMPLLAYPSWSHIFLEILPFRYTLSFPIEILMGFSQSSEIANGFIIASIWLFMLIVTYRILFKLAIKKHEAFGI